MDKKYKLPLNSKGSHIGAAAIAAIKNDPNIVISSKDRDFVPISSITPQISSHHKHRQTGSSTYNYQLQKSSVARKSGHHSGNSLNKNTNIATTIAVTNPSSNSIAMEKATSNSKTVARNKNEEAIKDLRTRIPEIENIFDVHSRIGNGTFSTVLLGTLKKEREVPESLRRKFAIKHHVPTSHPDRIMKELQCMAKIGGSNNVVGINCCIRYNESVAFIMPYLQHDRFHEFFNKMDLTELQNYMQNLLVALRHVHKFNVIHRDVKPSNFLYNRKKKQFLLVDFGLAQQVPASQTIGEHIHAGGEHLAQPNITECKRPRPEGDNKAINEKCADNHMTSNESNPIKRIRYGTPHEDMTEQPKNNEAFKMPLKQLNEIAGGNGSGSEASANSNNRSQSKHSNDATNNNNPSANTGSTNNIDVTNVNKYNTNRNMPTKCCCYGNPQVCNICLIKKEIHASRAGTPGYRPPEVLLKYADQTTSVDIWAAGVIFLSILSSVYPFFKAPNDYVALAEMVTIFGDKTIRKTAFILDRLVTLSQRTKPLDLRKLCVRFRNRLKFSSPELLHKYQQPDGSCEVCKNCDQFFFNCLCTETIYNTEPLDGDDPFPASAYDLLNKLLEVNPHKRITAEEALKHPFFSETKIRPKGSLHATEESTKKSSRHS